MAVCYDYNYLSNPKINPKTYASNIKNVLGWYQRAVALTDRALKAKNISDKQLQELQLVKRQLEARIKKLTSTKKG